ncbi:hypothetical protein [Bauldia sp.]|uniref:hypothetical protein n=1 Tax=Bauldia sp. TaxID=2575872 RepID=UPI003BA86C74
MRVLGVFTAALFAAITSASMAQASDLIGTWTAETSVILELDDEIVEAPRIFTIVIESVNGQIVRGTKSWKAGSDDPGYIDDESVFEATEPVIGALSGDGKTLRLVEVDDHGLMFATRIGDDEIELTYMEGPPHAVAYTAIFQRQE